jgi:hypothetical protein
MSMRVMQAKYNSRVKLQQINSRNTTNGGPFALNYVGRGINQGCCANIPKAPSRQQSYGLYLKRATMGIGGVASKVVGEKFIDPSFNRGEQQATLTYKRPQEFTTSNYINNKKAKALRREYSSKDSFGACKIVEDPICHNNCGKNITITQDLGYLTAGQQINKKLALRAGHGHCDYLESTIMTNGSCETIKN